MGKRGKVPRGKRAESDRNPPAMIVQLRDEPASAPPPPDVDPAVVEAWNAYMAADVAKVLDEVDLPLLRRWAHAYDQWLTTSAAVKAHGPYVQGSMGQPVLSPEVKYLKGLEADIQKYETELGMTPMARARLGLTVAEVGLTVAELNEMASRRRIEPGDQESDPPALEAEVVEISGWQEA